MAYVVANVETQVRVRHPRTGRETYSTKAAANAARTRYFRHAGYLSSELKVMTVEEYRAQVPMITVKNLMTQQDIKIAADTPWSCNPSSEAYWSM